MKKAFITLIVTAILFSLVTSVLPISAETEAEPISTAKEFAAMDPR